MEFYIQSIHMFLMKVYVIFHNTLRQKKPHKHKSEHMHIYSHVTVVTIKYSLTHKYTQYTTIQPSHCDSDMQNKVHLESPTSAMAAALCLETMFRTSALVLTLDKA